MYSSQKRSGRTIPSRVKFGPQGWISNMLRLAPDTFSKLNVPETILMVGWFPSAPCPFRTGRSGNPSVPCLEWYFKSTPCGNARWHCRRLSIRGRDSPKSARVKVVFRVTPPSSIATPRHIRLPPPWSDRAHAAWGDMQRTGRNARSKHAGQPAAADWFENYWWGFQVWLRGSSA